MPRRGANLEVAIVDTEEPTRTRARRTCRVNVWHPVRVLDLSNRATASASTSEPYACGRCRYQGVGHASAVEGATVHRGGLLFGNDRAGEMARDEAEARAWQEALSDVPMAPCPRCGAVDRKSWVRWTLSLRNLGSVVVGAASVAMAALLCTAILGATTMTGRVGAAVFCVATVPAGLALALAPLLRKRASSRRVRFEPER